MNAFPYGPVVCGPGLNALAASVLVMFALVAEVLVATVVVATVLAVVTMAVNLPVRSGSVLSGPAKICAAGLILTWSFPVSLVHCVNLT